MSFLSRTSLAPKTGAENNLSWRAATIATAAREFLAAAQELQRMAQRQEADYEASQDRLKDLLQFLWTALKTPLESSQELDDELERWYQKGQRHILGALAELLGYEKGQINPAMIELEMAKLEDESVHAS